MLYLSPHSYVLSPRQWGAPFLILPVSVLYCLLLTPGDTQNTHDPDDGGVDGQSGIDFNLLQCNAHDRQQHNGQVQLVPSVQQGS